MQSALVQIAHAQILSNGIIPVLAHNPLLIFFCEVWDFGALVGFPHVD
jgi:hypothetical protein